MSMSQRDERLESVQQPPASPSRQLNEFNAKYSYRAPHLPPSFMTEPSIMPPEVSRKPLQRGYSLHSDSVRNFIPPVDRPDSAHVAHSEVSYPSYQQHDRLGALTRSFSNHTSFTGHDKTVVDPITSARVRSKTPGPDFMRGTKPEAGRDEEGVYPARPLARSKTPTFHSSNRSAPSLRNRPPISGTPDFIPASQYTGPQDGFGYPGDPNWAPKMSSSSVSSTLHGSPHTDSTAGLLGMKVLNPVASSWTESPSSNFSEPGRHPVTRALYDEQFYEMPIYLRRLETGFGFRIIGGTEEGSQVCNSSVHISPR